MSYKIEFQNVRYGEYFKAQHLYTTHTLFVKRGAYSDEAYPVSAAGLADETISFEFGPTDLVEILDESEWPDCTAVYREQIAAWDWAGLTASMEVYLDEEDQPVYRTFLGTTLGLMPSGKIYAFWTSNQTAEDVNRDQCFNEALEAVAESHGVYVTWDSGDCFIEKSTSFEEVAKLAGYSVEETPDGLYHWVDNTLDAEIGELFEDEEEAWKACCTDNNLIAG